MVSHNPVPQAPTRGPIPPGVLGLHVPGGPHLGVPGPSLPCCCWFSQLDFFVHPPWSVLSPPGLQALETPSGRRRAPPPRLAVRGWGSASGETMERPGLIIWKTPGTALGHCPTRRTCPAVRTPVRGKGQDGGWGWHQRGPSRLANRTFLGALRTRSRGPTEGTSRLSLEALAILLDIPF